MNYNFNIPVNRIGTSCIKWDFQEMEFGRADLLPFTIADADYPSCPEIIQALSKRVKHGIFGYTDPSDDYYRAVASWCRRRHRWNVDASWIIPVSGIIPGIGCALEALTETNARILVQTPVYDPFYSVIRAAGRTLVRCPLAHNKNENTYQMNFSAIEEEFKNGISAVIICNPHNPVGRVWKAEELQQLIVLCRTYHVLLISDEIHWDLMIDGHIHTSIGSLTEPDDSVIVCTSCSKSFNLAGLQTSNFIIPNEELRQKYQEYLYGRYLFCPNQLGLTACQAAYESGEEWLEAQLAHLTGNAHFVQDYCGIHLPKVRIAPLEGTYLMWMDFNAYGYNSQTLIHAFAEAGAALGDGTHYASAFDGFIRMNIACPRPQLEHGLACMTHAIQKLCKEESHIETNH